MFPTILSFTDIAHLFANLWTANKNEIMKKKIQIAEENDTNFCSVNLPIFYNF